MLRAAGPEVASAIPGRAGQGQKRFTLYQRSLLMF